MASRRVLILFAHPALHKSRVNRRLVAAVRQLEGVTFHDLYEQYPDFNIDVAREQALLLEHDPIVLQHPMFWYSSPSIVKQWLDLVLEFGFAYGTGGTRLHGKSLLHAITTGGAVHAYSPSGYNHFTIRELLTPFEQTARFCGMQYLPPFIVYGTHGLNTEDAIRPYALAYRRTIECLRDGDLLEQDPARFQAINPVR